MATLNRYLTIEKDFDIVLTPSIDKEGGWNFLKMAAMGGLEIFTKNRGRGGGEPGMGGWEIFKVSLHGWQKGVNPPISWRPQPPYIAYPPFSKFCPTPSPPISLSHPTPNPTVLSVVLLLWLNGASRYTCQALVP